VRFFGKISHFTAGWGRRLPRSLGTNGNFPFQHRQPRPGGGRISEAERTRQRRKARLYVVATINGATTGLG